MTFKTKLKKTGKVSLKVLKFTAKSLSKMGENIEKDLEKQKKGK